MTEYRAQPVYILFAVVSLVVAGLFGWGLLQEIEAGSLLFFAVSLGLFAWNTRAALTTVSLAPDKLIFAAPPTRPRWP